MPVQPGPKSMGSEVGLSSSQPADLVPRPDPTLLTTSQLIREVTALKELIYVQFEARDQTIANLKIELRKVKQRVQVFEQRGSVGEARERGGLIEQVGILSRKLEKEAEFRCSMFEMDLNKKKAKIS